MELTAALFDLCKSEDRPILAIDGPAGAGKTTLADHLAAALSLKYKVQVVHMDDLYNGWVDAFDHHLTDALIAMAGAHRRREKLSISRYNWHVGAYSTAEELPSADLLIFEGVGSSQSAIRKSLTSTIWLEIDREQGLKRVIARDGEAHSSEMSQWLLLQEEYFIREDCENSADFILTTG
jgi:uridine kinase